MSFAQEAVNFANISASTAKFDLSLGGKYGVYVSATFGGGTVKLQTLSPDGSTWLDMQAPFNNAGTEADLVIGTFAANGMKVFDLPPAGYRFTITTASAVYAAVVRVPY